MQFTPEEYAAVKSLDSLLDLLAMLRCVRQDTWIKAHKLSCDAEHLREFLKLLA
jgi:hypothetical protein